MTQAGNTGFDIGARHIGDGHPCFIIGEVAMAHDGSLTVAHAYIDAISGAGADAVKFQHHSAEEESTPDEPWRVKPRWAQDANRYEYWKRTAFTAAQWADLKAHADDAGLIFLCSPFSVASVEVLDPLVPAWKIASGEVGNRPLIEACEKTVKPMIHSTGMSDNADISDIFNRHLMTGQPMALLQCTSEYPTPPQHVGLNLMQEYRKWGHWPVGLSDHSGGIYAGLVAMFLGCDILEVHVCLDRSIENFDTDSSITPAELRILATGDPDMTLLREPIEKDLMAEYLAPMRAIFADKWKRKAGLPL